MTEEQLAMRAGAGDETASETLALQMRGLVYTTTESFYAPGLEREDFHQAALVGLWGACRAYDRSVVGHNSSFAAFAAVCMRRNVATLVRTARRFKHRPLDDALSLDSSPVNGDGDVEGMHDAIPSVGLSALEVLVQQDELTRLVKVIANDLSQLERASLIGYVLCGESYAEIEARILAFDAERAGRAGYGPVKVVDNAITRARLKIKFALREEAA